LFLVQLRIALAIRDGAPDAGALWQGSHRHYIISHTESVSDLLEVLLLQKEVGLLRAPWTTRRRAAT
jgi:phosphoenolpyruvate carboxylase